MNSLGMKDELYAWWEEFDDGYERLYALATHIVEENPEATFYDLFNYIREDLFKGWPYDEESQFIQKIDLKILAEDGG